MSASKMLRMGVGLLGLAFLVGCAATITITSNPPGASVSVNGKYVGTTPVDAKVSDVFGPGSIYTFTATKNGYQPQTKQTREEGLEDARGAIPTHIHFDLEAVDE